MTPKVERPAVGTILALASTEISARKEPCTDQRIALWIRMSWPARSCAQHQFFQQSLFRRQYAAVRLAVDYGHRRDGPNSIQPRRCPVTPVRSVKGHEAQFPSATLSARYRFGQVTFAGRRATSETRRFRTLAEVGAAEKFDTVEPTRHSERCANCGRSDGRAGR